MHSFVSGAVVVLSLLTEACAFTGRLSPKVNHVSPLKMSDYNDDDRRAFISKIAAAATGLSFLPTQPAFAFGDGGLNKINSQLSSYGLPLMGKVPDGFSPLLELYGKGKNRVPLLVQFQYPSEWIVQLPNIDVNGEEGTIQAGQYSAGDTATFYLLKGGEKVEDIASQPKEFFQNAIIKAISQKGSNIYQNFKVTKVEPGKGDYKNQNYMIVDFKYDLLTGAGFEVQRQGVASVTNQGDAVQVLWAASTAVRYKKTGDKLRTIANSFRCYSEGLSLAVQSVANQKNYDDYDD